MTIQNIVKYLSKNDLDYHVFYNPGSIDLEIKHFLYTLLRTDKQNLQLKTSDDLSPGYGSLPMDIIRGELRCQLSHRTKNGTTPFFIIVDNTISIQHDVLEFLESLLPYCTVIFAKDKNKKTCYKIIDIDSVCLESPRLLVKQCMERY